MEPEKWCMMRKIVMKESLKKENGKVKEHISMVTVDTGQANGSTTSRMEKGRIIR